MSAAPIESAVLLGARSADAPPARTAASAARMGMWLAMAAIAMLFLAFTSAYIVRVGLDPQWRTNSMPRLLPANTVLLLLSSVLLEIARRARRQNGWLLATLATGALFVAGQVAAWLELSASGLHFASNSHASFFYTLTAVHGVHLAGGLLALGFAAAVPGSRPRWLPQTALYWHFMGALWLYLLSLLFGTR